jgi:hypothetical protein
MQDTQNKLSRAIPSIDLAAAFKHDRRIATQEGFKKVAERADENLKWLDLAIAEAHTQLGHTGWVQVSIVVEVVEP